MDEVRSQLRQAPSPAVLSWVAGQLGSRARVDAWARLPGGSACAVHAVDVVDAAGRRHPLVLKRFVRRDWLAREPDIAAREASHLAALAPVDLPIPRLVAADPDGSACDVPALLMTRLPGRARLLPDDEPAWLRALVLPLLTLHAIPGERLQAFAPYRSYHDPEALAVPAWSSRPDVWERVFERVRGEPPAFVPRFVHRDYHPANLLFTGDRVSGVLDFTDSSRGPAATDLGHCRLNLAQLHGPGVAERFLRTYASLAPGLVELDPYWDLLALVGVMPLDEVYWGWAPLGVRGLELRTVRERIDAYAADLVTKLA